MAGDEDKKKKKKSKKEKEEKKEEAPPPEPEPEPEPEPQPEPQPEAEDDWLAGGDDTQGDAPHGQAQAPAPQAPSEPAPSEAEASPSKTEGPPSKTEASGGTQRPSRTWGDTVITHWKEEPTGEEAPPAEGQAQEGVPEEAMEMPPAPKKKPKFFVHWNRRKPRFYDYNWDYGDNYYSNLVKYMDNRTANYPRRMAFAERGIRSNVARRATPDTRTSNLLDDVRKSIRNFELSQRTYMK